MGIVERQQEHICELTALLETHGITDTTSNEKGKDTLANQKGARSAKPAGMVTTQIRFGGSKAKMVRKAAGALPGRPQSRA